MLFNKAQTTLVAFPGGRAGSYTIPDSVASIGDQGFSGCTSLTSVTIGNSVTGIADLAFWGCTSLTSVYFKGNAPSLGDFVFSATDSATVYYLPGTAGWGGTYGGRPTALWLPKVLTGDPGFGVQEGQFSFAISWANDRIVVVEAASDLTSPDWVPLSTNTLVDGVSTFTDPDWADHPSRFYRLREP